MTIKILVIYIISIILIVTFNSCNDNISIPIDSDKLYCVSGIVYDVISNDYSPLPKKSALIYFDKDSTFTDNDGRFVFRRIKMGDYLIRITLPEYEPFLKSVSVRKDTSIVVFIYGKKEDYFPVNKMTRIIFKYTAFASNSIITVNDSGLAYWNIWENQVSDNTKYYYAKETLIFQRTDNYGNSSLVSMIHDFQIWENSHNKIFVKYGPLDGVTFDRFLDPRLEEKKMITRTFNNPSLFVSSVSIYLKKDLGLFSIVQTGNSMTKKYEFKEMVFNY